MFYRICEHVFDKCGIHFLVFGDGCHLALRIWPDKHQFAGFKLVWWLNHIQKHLPPKRNLPLSRHTIHPSQWLYWDRQGMQFAPLNSTSRQHLHGTCGKLAKEDNNHGEMVMGCTICKLLSAGMCFMFWPGSNLPSLLPSGILHSFLPYFQMPIFFPHYCCCFCQG